MKNAADIDGKPILNNSWVMTEILNNSWVMTEQKKASRWQLFLVYPQANRTHLIQRSGFYKENWFYLTIFRKNQNEIV